MLNKLIKSSFFSVFLILFFLPTETIAQQRTITGVVRDSATHELLSYVAILLRGTSQGVSTDDNGRFTLKNVPDQAVLKVTSVGYKSQDVTIVPGATEVVIDLAPDDYLLDEVVVKPKKEKYSRKNNPAVALARKLIERRDLYKPENEDYFNYERYEKMTFALNDFSDEQKKKWLFKKFQFIFDYVDTSEVSGKPILTVSIKEMIENTHYRKNPHAKRQIVSGIKRAGLDEMFNQESLQQFLSEVFKEVDIFGNDITLMLNRFVSPLSSIGPAFYKYYLMDSVYIDGVKCIDLAFAPFNPQSFGFVGHLYVQADSSYFIKKAKFNVPKAINLNFVDNLSIEQTFEQAPNGVRLMTRDDMIVEFQLAANTQQIYSRRTNTYKNFSFDPPADPAIFDKAEQIIVESDAELKPDAFWDDNRHIPIKAKENAVERLLTQLRSVPVFYYLEKFVKILVSGYVETANPSKFDFGPMNTTISGNTVEGARFRVGGGTTANLNPHWFVNGYLAYGTRDGKFKYKGEVEYAFNKKKYHTNEFPIHSLRLTHVYDIDQLGQHYLYTNKDNVFLSLKRKSDTRATYERKTELGYTWEHSSGFSYQANLKYRTQEATRWVQFIEEDGTYAKNFSMAEAELNLRYAPNEKYYQTKQNRYPISKDAPIFTLSHTLGLKGIFDSRYNMNKTEFGVQKRFWFSAFGYTDVILKAGKVWDKVPYPLLILPNANLSYTIQSESYPLMNAMEFINDEFVSWDITYYMNGALFNRLPLIKYLKLREVFSFRGLYGNLTDKNNPNIDRAGLFAFPQGSYIMGKLPYMEVGVGIENIFKVLRVDYVWRLTYRNHPDIDRSGVRIALHFTF